MTGCTSINTLIFVGTASCCSLEGSEQRGVDMRAHLVVQRVHGRGGARGLERGGPHASILRRIGRFSACSMLLHRRCARRRRTVAAGTLRPSLSTRIFDAWPPIALSHTRGIDESTMRAEQGDRIAALAQHRREWMNRRFALQREHVRGRDGRRQQAPARLEGAYDYCCKNICEVSWRWVASIASNMHVHDAALVDLHHLLRLPGACSEIWTTGK